MVLNNEKEMEHWEGMSGAYLPLLAFSRRCETLLVSLSFILCLLSRNPLSAFVCIGTGLYSDNLVCLDKVNILDGPLAHCFNITFFWFDKERPKLAIMAEEMSFLFKIAKSFLNCKLSLISIMP